ncbi:hypothetical protein LUW77_00860 [Streptomyces radiopugnans]|nr:hypothetical protein LUW77_00860 [Streptomyces radiopugnans]
MTVVVTGLGAVSCFGSGTAALWDGLLRADRRPVPAPDACGLPTRPYLYAAPDPGPVLPDAAASGGEPAGRTSALVAAAVAEAVGDAGLTAEDLRDA